MPKVKKAPEWQWWKAGSNCVFHAIDLNGSFNADGRHPTACGKAIKLFRSDRAILRSRHEYCVNCHNVTG